MIFPGVPDGLFVAALAAVLIYVSRGCRGIERSASSDGERAIRLAKCRNKASLGLIMALAFYCEYSFDHGHGLTPLARCSVAGLLTGAVCMLAMSSLLQTEERWRGRPLQAPGRMALQLRWGMGIALPCFLLACILYATDLLPKDQQELPWTVLSIWAVSLTMTAPPVWPRRAPLDAVALDDPELVGAVRQLADRFGIPLRTVWKVQTAGGEYALPFLVGRGEIGLSDGLLEHMRREDVALLTAGPLAAAEAWESFLRKGLPISITAALAGTCAWGWLLWRHDSMGTGAALVAQLVACGILLAMCLLIFRLFRQRLAGFSRRAAVIAGDPAALLRAETRRAVVQLKPGQAETVALGPAWRQHLLKAAALFGIAADEATRIIDEVEAERGPRAG